MKKEIREAPIATGAAADANDFDVEHDIYREDAVLDYPQSGGERIRGRHNIQASRVAAAELEALRSSAPHRRHGRPLGHGIYPHV